MAGTTGLEPAASAVTALPELVLQLRTTRGLPNIAQVVQDAMNCGLEICLSMQPRRSVLFPNLDLFSSGWIPVCPTAQGSQTMNPTAELRRVRSDSRSTPLLGSCSNAATHTERSDCGDWYPPNPVLDSSFEKSQRKDRKQEFTRAIDATPRLGLRFSA